MASVWSNEEIQTLVDLWPTKSATEISKIIKRNRNSIIGRVHRMGLPTKRLVEVRKVYHRAAERRYGHPIAEPAPKSPKRTGKPFVFKTTEAERKPPQYVAPTQIWSGEGVAFLEAGYGQCRAVMGSSNDPNGFAVFCGKRIKEGSALSFCEEHNRQYTQKPWGRS